MEYDYDTVIVGGGVAGALTAWSLSQGERSPRILILEAGDNRLDGDQRAEFVDAYMRAPSKGTTSPYNELASARPIPSPEGGSDPAVLNRYFVEAGPDLYKSNYLRVLGGSTWTWRGNTPRFIYNDFRLKELYGVGEDWPLTYDDVESWYCEAERELGVSGNDEEWDGLLGAYRTQPFPMPGIVPSYGDKLIMKAISGLEIDARPVQVIGIPQARNSRPYDGRPVCEGYGTCIPICPNASKYDASVHLGKAQAQGVELRPRSVVTRLEVEPGGSDVHTIFYRDWSVPDRGEQRVTARVVVLAGNSIETPRLWLLSGLGNRSDQIGRNLMDHLAEEVTGLFPEPVYPFRGPQSNVGIDIFRDGEYRRTAGSFRMTIGADGWGRKEHPFASLERFMWSKNDNRLLLFGKELQREVEHRVTRMVRVGYSTEQLPDPNNRVTLADEKDPLGVPRPRLSYTVDDYSKKALAYGHSVAFRILSSIKGMEEIDPQEPEGKYNGAGHPMGTCRMGRNAETAVVDSDGRSFEHPNVFVVGASVFVTGSAANPTLTLAALSLRTADRIKASYQRSSGASRATPA